MNFSSFVRLFGERWRTKASKRTSRTARRLPLGLERLETRELLSNYVTSPGPRVIDFAPANLSVTTEPMPAVFVKYSEPMAVRTG